MSNGVFNSAKFLEPNLDGNKVMGIHMRPPSGPASYRNIFTRDIRIPSVSDLAWQHNKIELIDEVDGRKILSMKVGANTINHDSKEKEID